MAAFIAASSSCLRLFSSPSCSAFFFSSSSCFTRWASSLSVSNTASRRSFSAATCFSCKNCCNFRAYSASSLSFLAFSAARSASSFCFCSARTSSAFDRLASSSECATLRRNRSTNPSSSSSTDKTTVWAPPTSSRGMNPTVTS